MRDTVTLKQFHTPFNSASIRKLLGQLFRASSEQKTAASLATSLMAGGIARHKGTIQDIWLVSGAACASGESMTFDILKNGTSILSGVYTLDSTKPNKEPISLLSLLDPTKADITWGDKLEVTRVYTAGGGPTPLINTRLDVEWAPNQDSLSEPDNR